MYSSTIVAFQIIITLLQIIGFTKSHFLITYGTNGFHYFYFNFNLFSKQMTEVSLAPLFNDRNVSIPILFTLLYANFIGHAGASFRQIFMYMYHN